MILNIGANHPTWIIPVDSGLLRIHYPTFPSTRRLRFPWGRNKPVRMGWLPKCQSKVEQSDDGDTWALSRSLETGIDGFWVRIWSFGIQMLHNPSQHFDKDGNEL